MSISPIAGKRGVGVPINLTLVMFIVFLYRMVNLNSYVLKNYALSNAQKEPIHLFAFKEFQFAACNVWTSRYLQLLLRICA